MTSHAPDQTAIAPDGVHLAWSSVGAGDPVVLVHGFASSRDQNWGSTGWIDRLVTAGYRVVSFDCRGHGKSDKPHDPAAYGENLVGDIVAVMDAAGISKAKVMGYSMGAILSIRLAVLHPERVEKVVAAGIGENYFGEAADWGLKVAKGLLTDDPQQIEDDEARKFRIFGGQKGKDRVALAACMTANRPRSTPDELKKIAVPVLVVAGETDTLVKSPFSLAAHFAHGRAVVLPNKDHMTAVGDPGYKRAVLDFFAA
ncbi:pimeloyl-ACP methyl ester carboxylesterase [Rhizomicrobium palustre]|uniref:Pimeloyl-ACP methyl ester carboxylesterase n=1 Tax=Rhizomicrobium palustre TaxID=189966 RepID=A0A846MVH2_9PROT|nr:alpha/beta hydrolase [Rhizomicrobium palustre]NIK87363.1 pimeloyl-ACP methyl ester carboxylesterase [Rhizomicrobium palustre]